MVKVIWGVKVKDTQRKKWPWDHFSEELKQLRPRGTCVRLYLRRKKEGEVQEDNSCERAVKGSGRGRIRARVVSKGWG